MYATTTTSARSGVYRPEAIADRRVKVGTVAGGEGDDVVAVLEFNCSRTHEQQIPDQGGQELDRRRHQGAERRTAT